MITIGTQTLTDEHDGSSPSVRDIILTDVGHTPFRKLRHQAENSVLLIEFTRPKNGGWVSVEVNETTIGKKQKKTKTIMFTVPQVMADELAKFFRGAE